MSRAAQIGWWLTQVETARRAVASAQEDRRRPRRPGLPDEEARARAARVERMPAGLPAARVIQGATITGDRDEERTRSLPALSGGGSPGLGRTPSAPAPVVSVNGGGNASGLASTMTGRARQLAAGYQPAVIKVASYARGAARATATGQYVLREDVALETHDGRMLGDRQAVAEVIKAWSTDFVKRAESQDVVAVRLKLHGVRDTPEGRQKYEEAVAAGFSGHRHVYRIDTLPSGELEARLVVAMAGTSKERFRVREERVGDAEHGFNQRRLDVASEGVVKAEIETATG